jgi:nitrogenase subunit NifH
MEFCERHDIQFWGEVPWSEDVVQADLAGVPLLDAVPDGEAVAAISRLADTIGEAAHAQTVAYTAAQGG